MKTIGLTGANGQVGFEVTAILAKDGLAKPIAIGRTDYSLATLRRLGVVARSGNLADSADSSRLLDGCDLLADFAWPHGIDAVMSPQVQAHIKNSIVSLPVDAHYVFISTQSVFRLLRHEPSFKIYGLAKRRAERLAISLGQRLNKKVYVLRLGEVHGPFQNCSRCRVADFRDQTALVPRLKSGVVWGHNIAEALLRIAEGGVRPGVYTLLAHPEWSYREVHAYYAKWAGLPCTVVEEEPPRDSGWLRNRLDRLAESGRGLVVGLAVREKELIEWSLYRLNPSLAQRLRLRHYQKSARRDIQTLEDARQWRPYRQEREVPGRRFTALTDVRSIIFERNRELLEWVNTRLNP